MKKFELPEQPQKTNTSKDFTVAKEAIANLDKFDYAWKSYSHKLEKRFTAAIKYIEELENRLKECEDLRIEANNSAAMEYSRKCEVVEERAELKRENQRLRAENLAVKTLVEDAKKQQPALPEVPQFVAELIKKRKGNWSLFGAFRNISGNKYDNEKLYEWVFAHAGRQEIFAQAWTNGYTVKEKRFYLKNKLTGQRLIRLLEENGGGFLECVTSTDKERMQFTQSEIDSMAAESYEQILIEEN